MFGSVILEFLLFFGWRRDIASALQYCLGVCALMHLFILTLHTFVFILSQCAQLLTYWSIYIFAQFLLLALFSTYTASVHLGFEEFLCRHCEKCVQHVHATLSLFPYRIFAAFILSSDRVKLWRLGICLPLRIFSVSELQFTF